MNLKGKHEAPPTSECTNQAAVGDGPQLTQATPVGGEAC